MFAFKQFSLNGKMNIKNIIRQYNRYQFKWINIKNKTINNDIFNKNNLEFKYMLFGIGCGSIMSIYKYYDINKINDCNT